jgi:amino acid adenylation domain-containing protein
MSRPAEPDDHRTQLARSLAAIKALRSRVEDLERSRREPIAIVGLGCRFPGAADDPESYWRLLRDGVDAVGPVPADRWDAAAFYDPDPDAPGKAYVREGGFLAEVAGFDAELFGISPREAAAMDPQQRLLLEVAWEALEHAGQAPERLAGSRTGVFIGVMGNDYTRLQMGADPARVDAWVGTGNGSSFEAGRLSYVFGLQGPSMVIGTACSSSLVAVHLACQSLREGECSMALAGGVSLMLSPDATVVLSKMRALAADGRSKTFDAAADGYGRGEGCGLVVLKRLSDALAAGDPVLAVIRGSAVNHDGRSNGLTAPNGAAQQAVLRQALAAAGVEPGEVGYVEAHGTGTVLGDPIELRALTAVLGPGRGPDSRLVVGSVKTNFGHLEAAAGIAGLIKVVLALRHGEIPPHLHLRNLNPHISLAEMPLVIPTAPHPWPAGETPRIAGISSFGLSGINAHILLAEAPVRAEGQGQEDRPLHLLALSARSEAALRALAGRYRDRLADPAAGVDAVEIADACFTANAGRSHLPERLAVVAASREELLARLEDAATGRSLLRTPSPRRRPAPRVAFLFTGQGAQQAGMGRLLFATQPTFRRALETCDEILRPHLEAPLLSVLYPPDGAPSPIDRTAYAQPALFALEHALATLWRSWGIEPVAVLGHSLGEYAAACFAGAFSLEDGLRLVAERGRLMDSLPPGGAMAAVFAGPERAAGVLAGRERSLSLAAVNAPDRVVLSGDAEALEEALASLRRDGVDSRPLRVSHAFHSPRIEPILDALEAAAARVRFTPPRIGLISNLDGRQMPGDTPCDAAYWRRHSRAPVLFEEGLKTLASLGCDALVEIGPKPVLLELGRRCRPEQGIEWLPSLRPAQDDWRQMLDSLGRLYVAGATVDWAGFDRDYRRRRVALPTYPFERQRHWLDLSPGRRAVPAHRNGHGRLLGERLSLPVAESVFESTISAASPAFVGDHRVFGAAVLPASAYVEMALAGAATTLGTGAVTLERVAIRRPLVLDESEERQVHLVLSPPEGGVAGFRIHSRPEGGEDGWQLHATGAVRSGAPEEAPFDLAALQARRSAELPVPAYYDNLAERGLVYGERLRALEGLWPLGGGEALARVRLPRPETHRFHLHPVLLDACFQALGAALPEGAGDGAFLPVGIERLTVERSAGEALWAHLRVRTVDGAPGSLAADLDLFDDAGQPVARLRGLELRRAEAEALRPAADEGPGRWLYEVAWRPRPLQAVGLSADFLPEPAELAGALHDRLDSLGEKHGLAAGAGLVPRLEALSAAYAARALARLGWTPVPGAPLTVAGLGDALGVEPRHRRLLARLLEILEEEGVLRRLDSATWEAVRVPDWTSPLLADPEAERRRCLEEHPGGDAELTLLGRCGDGLAAALAGRVDPLELLFPGGSPELAERLYRDSPFSRAYNDLMGEAVAAALARRPAGRPLRILEVGGGTGATTQAVLGLLPTDCEYVFSDVSPLFLQRAATRLPARPGLRFQALDLEREPAEQGLVPGSFDLVLAANVLHATQDLRRTLGHVRRLLAPEGLLLLLEGTARQRWVDLVFGLTEGWWAFSDLGDRPDHPLVSARRWIEILAASGFSTASAVPDDPAARQALIAARADVESGPEAGAWLLLADRSGVAAGLAGRLAERGARCHLVLPGPALARTGDRAWEVDPLDAGQLGRLRAEIEATDGRLRGAIHLWALDAEDHEGADQTRICGGALALVQALVRDVVRNVGGGGLPRLFLVTRGAWAVDGTEPALSPAQSTLWGFGRTVALEHPGLRCGCIDLDPSGDPAEPLFTEVWTAACGGGGDDQVALREGGRRVARLTRATAGSAALRPRPDGAYAITGGFGGLGLLVARRLVERGARHLLLIGRSAPSEAALEAVRSLEAQGARIELARADAADAAALAAALAGDGTRPPLRGAIHAAGTLEDGVIAQQTWDRFSRVLAPKVEGGWNLHRLTLDEPLDFFVLFSSAVSLLGSPGQSNHAAASTFLDSLAEHRRALGLPALSLDWGAWSEVGAAAERGVEGRVDRQGVGIIPPDAGLDLFERLLGQPAARVGILPVDWPRFLERLTGAVPPFLEEMSAETSASRPTVSGGAAGAEIRRRLGAASPDERRTLLVEHLRTEAAEVLGFGPARPVEPWRPLQELGLDSLMAVELKNRVELGLGLSLPLGGVLEGSSVDDLAGTLLAQIEAGGAPEQAADEPLPRLEPAPAERHLPFPLTDIQQAYWVGRGAAIELGNVGCHFYYELEGEDLDVERLERAWQALVARHDMLRAIVQPDGYQRILASVPEYRLDLLDLRGLPAEQAEAALEERRRTMSHEVFAPERWPLFALKATLLDGGRARIHIGIDLLIVDAAGLFRLLEEWSVLYRDPAAPLPPLPLSFRDYVLAENEFRRSARYLRSREYWLERLRTLPPAPELPLRRDPAGLDRPRFVRHQGGLEAERWLRLKERAREAGLTPSGVLCAAYAEALAAWSKEPRFTINLTLFRHLPFHPAVKELVGDFTSTVLVEADGSGGSFAARAAALQQQLNRDLDHSYFSGIQVLRELNRQRGGVTAAMPVVFTSLLGYGRGARSNEPVSWLGRPVFSVSQTPQVWIDHQVFENGDDLQFNWDTIDEIFPEGLIDDLFAAYCRLLVALADDPEVWRSAAPRLVPETQLALLEAVNATAAPLPEGLLHEPFAARATEDAGRLAVAAADGRRLGYGELRDRSRRLAGRLREMGAQPNHLVAVILEKGWEQAVAVLGILEAGAAYLPVSPALPAERIGYLLRNGEVEVVVTHPRLDASLAWPDGVRRLVIEDEPTVPGAPLAPAQTPEDLAYVIFTSGSTGEPKGVMIDHRGARNTVEDINERFGIGPGDRVLALSDLGFDLSVWDLFGPLAAGGAVVLPAPDRLRDPEHWLARLWEEEVTVWNSVPALLEMLVEFAAGKGVTLPPSLRLVLLSGDWIPVGLPDRLRALAPGAQVVSLGGATEASIWSVLYPIGAVDPAWTSIPYGRPLRNQTVHVLDGHLRPRPVQVPGHLYIGGRGVARGYWRDEEKTRSRFSIHQETSEHLYATGDLARFLPDGNLELLGREDLQVKIQGHRIELGEVETALGRSPRVRAAAVVADGPRGRRRLVAYVVPEPGEASGNLESALAEHLREQLPAYMVPARFVVLESLPLTSNGKVDRRALPSADAASADAASADAASADAAAGGGPAPLPPRTDLERRLAAVWSEILGIEVENVHDGFFELGGSSLSMIQLHNRLGAVLEREIPVVELFRHTTVAALADYLTRSRLLDGPDGGRAPATALVPIQLVRARPPLFCVPGATGASLYFADLARGLGSDQPVYGLQAPGIEGDRRPLSTIQDMADHYLQAILAVQERGPYLFAGQSHGGYVAFEMAQQLHRRGQEVAFLGMFDTMPVLRLQQSFLTDDNLAIDLLVRVFCNIFEQSLALHYRDLPPGTPQQRLDYLLDRLKGLSLVSSRLLVGGLLDVFRANLEAVVGYQPAPYPGRITLFRSRGLPEGYEDVEVVMELGPEDPTFGWAQWSALPVDVLHVPGDHVSMLKEPNVREVAARLRAAVDRALGY